MSERTPSIHCVFTTLASEGLIGTDWQQRVATVVATQTEVQPWFIRVMVGLGAWIASLMIFTALAVGTGVVSTTAGFVVLGLMLIGGAVALHNASEHDFALQFALAASLAGQLSLIWGVASATESVEASMLTLIVIQVVLIFVFRDPIHRFLSVLFAVCAVVTLIYKWENQELLPVLATALACAFTLLELNQASYTGYFAGKLIRPVAYGSLGASLGIVMLSTVYLLPELALHDFAFYPHPWVSTLGFGAILLYLCHRLLIRAAAISASRALLIHLFAVVVIVASLPAPGVVISLATILLGFAHANRLLTASGLAFFAVFIGAYFYGTEVTLLTKSATLALTGIVILTMRLVVAKALQHDDRSVHHA